MRVEGRGRARKPSRLGGAQGFQRLQRWLVDRGAPIRGLPGAAALDLGNGILARELGVSDRSIRSWLARLREEGRLSAWTHARKVAGAWAGQVRVLVIHEPGMGAQAELWGKTARVRARGHWRDLSAFRFTGAADVPVELPAAPARGMEGATKRRRFRTASPESPYGAPGEIEAPSGAREAEPTSPPKLRPPAIRAARRRLWAFGLRGDGLDAVSGYVQRALEAFPASEARILGDLEALEDRARRARCGPARFILGALRRGWAPWDEPSGPRPDLPRLTPDLVAMARLGIPDPVAARTPLAEAREVYAWAREELAAMGLGRATIGRCLAEVRRVSGKLSRPVGRLRPMIGDLLATARRLGRDPGAYVVAALRNGWGPWAQAQARPTPRPLPPTRAEALAALRVAKAKAVAALAPPAPDAAPRLKLNWVILEPASEEAAR